MRFAVSRRFPGVLVAAAACVALPHASLADTFGVTKSSDTTIDTRGLVLDSTVADYGIGINGTSFENNAITTYNGWQYTAYWVRTGTTSTSNYVAVARRPVGGATWQVANLTNSVFTNGLKGTKPSDAHNVVSLGIDEIDGTLHLAYDLHGDTIKYRVSNSGVATNPNAITAANWGQSLFQTQRNWLVNSGTPVATVTYPHFIRKNNGGLQLTYRTGGSGAGSNWIADYVSNSPAQAWTNVHQYDDGFTGTYTGTVTSGDTTRNSYINGATYGPSGRLYQSFTWREGATGAANHDIAFVYSDDNGNIWKNNAGTVVGNNATGQKFNLTTAGLTVVPLDESQSLMNQQTQAVSGNSAATERFHTLMWHRDTAKANTGGVYTPTESSYFHYWRDGDGNFHRSKLPGQVGSRPKLFFDASDNAFAIYQLGSFSLSGIYINNGDLVIAAATKASNWNDWKVIQTEAGPFVSEAQADVRLFALTGTLSVTMQNSPTSLGSAQATNMRAMDYTFAVTPATNVAATVSGSWSNPATWGGTPPAGNANAVINGHRTVSLDSGTTANVESVIVGSGGSVGTLLVNGGSALNVAGSISVGRGAGVGDANYTQGGGTVTAWRMAIGDFTTEANDGGYASASVRAGTLTVGELQIGMGRGTSFSNFGTGSGSVGSRLPAVNVNGEVIVGDLGNNARFTIQGGTVTVAGDIHEGLAGSISQVDVAGGTLDMTGNSILADTVSLNTGRLQNVKAIRTGTITKDISGTIAFAGTNTFTQPLVITTGAIRAESDAALGTTAGNTTISNSTSVGELQLANNITLAEPLVLVGRQPLSAGDTSHITNVGGTNTLTGTINTGNGGSQYNVSSTAGKLIVAGNFINNGTGGAADVRTLKLNADFEAEGEWQSNINNASGNAAVTAVTKNGQGIWTLAGANTYTGATTINGGTLRMGQIAVPAAIATYSFDGVSGSTVTNTGTGGATLNGTLVNGATIVAGGQSGNAVSVSNGASVDINSPITDLGPTGAWTVSAWVKTATAGGSILSKTNGGWASGNTAFYLGDDTGAGSGGVPSSVRYAGGFFQGAAGSASVIDNAWHLVTYVNNGGAFGLYVDGVAQPLSAGNSGLANADVGSVVRLGVSTNPGDGATSFNGLLDNVQFYNTALGGARIAGLYGGNSYGTLPATTALTIAAGGTLDVNGTAQQVASLNGAAGSAVILSNGRLTVNTIETDVFAGDISGNNGMLVKTGNGTLALTGANAYTGGTVVNGGVLRVNYSDAVTSAATPIMTTAAGVDLQNGRLVFDYTGSVAPAGLIRATLAASREGNFAAGRFRSSSATLVRGIGYVDDGTTVTLMATLYGDTDLDGGVSINDFNALAGNFGKSTAATWANGDFDYDGGVSINDFNLLAANFGQTLPGSASSVDYAGLLAFAAAHDDLAAFAAITGVPEPTSLGFLAAGVSLVSRRRRASSSSHS